MTRRLVWVAVGVMLWGTGADLAIQASGRATFTAAFPMAITSCGQSADALTVSLLSRRMRLDHAFEPLLNADALPRFRTLIVVVGGSLKGLGEVGMDEQRELARVGGLLARARRTGVTVIAVHVGGAARRGSISDRFIGLVIAEADFIIVTEAGNVDGLFTKVSRARAVPLVVVAQPAEVGRELKALFPAPAGAW
jgi:hypothetical protein